jgi:hypothetical protein
MKKEKKEKDNWYHIRPHYYIHTPPREEENVETIK